MECQRLIDCIYKYHGGCLLRGRICVPFVDTCVQSRFLVEFVLLFFFLNSFCCCSIMCRYVLSSCCDVRYDFRVKTMFGSSSPPVVCRRVHVLFTLFVFVSLDCPLLIAIRYSQTFNCYT